LSWQSRHFCWPLALDGYRMDGMLIAGWTLSSA
jgi:hypothetical protein